MTKKLILALTLTSLFTLTRITSAQTLTPLTAGAAPVAVTSITAAGGIVFTSTDHGFTNGQVVNFATTGTIAMTTKMTVLEAGG